MPPPELPGLAGGEFIRSDPGSVLFKMSDSATGAPRLVRVAAPERVAREAKILARLADIDQIAHLVEERGTADGRSALVTQYVEGSTVRATLDHRALPWAPAVRAAMSLAEVLGAVHEHGVVHGAICPEHLILASPAPVVVGFGEARAAGSPYQASAQQAEWAAPGTVGKEAPASPADDVYALAAVLYALVTRRSPARAARHKKPEATAPSGPLLGDLPPIAAPGAPPALTQALAYALAPRPEARYLESCQRVHLA
jgi:serine/threonine protein kinase